MSRIKKDAIIGWRDDEFDYCEECAPKNNDGSLALDKLRPITADNCPKDAIITCDECEEIIIFPQE